MWVKIGEHTNRIFFTEYYLQPYNGKKKVKVKVVVKDYKSKRKLSTSVLSMTLKDLAKWLASIHLTIDDDKFSNRGHGWYKTIRFIVEKLGYPSKLTDMYTQAILVYESRK